MPSSSQARSAGSSSLLRAISLYALGVGAAVTAAFVLRAGSHNRSAFLVALFFFWAVSPFFGLVAAGRAASRSRRDIASAMHASTLVLALVPAALYAIVSCLAPGHITTFAFLVVPAASWLAIATLLIAARLQRK